MIKPRAISIQDGAIHIKGLFRSWRFSAADVLDIEVAKTVSLTDEIGISITAGETFFFTDADENALKVTQYLNFIGLFGDDWFARAESGERLSWKSSDNKAWSTPNTTSMV